MVEKQEKEKCLYVENNSLKLGNKSFGVSGFVFDGLDKKGIIKYTPKNCEYCEDKYKCDTGLIKVCFKMEKVEVIWIKESDAMARVQKKINEKLKELEDIRLTVPNLPEWKVIAIAHQEDMLKILLKEWFGMSQSSEKEEGKNEIV